MFYYITFDLQKGEGCFPDLEHIKSLFASKDPLGVIKKHMAFSFNNDNALLPVDEYFIIDHGLNNLEFVNGGLVNSPKPIVWLKLHEEVDPEDMDFWHDALMSDYKLSIPKINDTQPFFFQDHNGYSKVIYSEHLADDLWEKLEYWAQKLDLGQKVEINQTCTMKKRENHEGEPYNITLEISCNGNTSTWGWTFESREDLNQFEPSDNFYSDTENCEYPEENPNLFLVHHLIYNMF